MLTPIGLRELPDRPLVSVIVSSYNYASYLGAAIESVLTQTYPHVELIVCDDGSVDCSPGIVESWAAKDPRVRLIVQDNAGQGAAWNHAFQESTGDIICFLDSDDLFGPDKVERVLSAFRGRPAAGVAIHQLLPVTRNGTAMPPAIPWELSDGWVGTMALKSGGRGSWPTSSAICIRREVADRIFPIPLDFRLNCDTYVLGASQFLTEVAGVPCALGQHRVHGLNAGGGARPTPQTVRHEASYNELTVHQLKRFLCQHFGPEVALALRREDSDYFYWEQLLALFVLDHRPIDVFGYCRADLVAHVPRFTLRQFWRVVTRCPSPLDRWLLELYWASKPWWRRVKYSVLYCRKSC